MPRKSTTHRLQSLRQKRDQLDAQLKLLEAREKDIQRKADTRRKVIAGALAMEHFEANPGSEFARVMMRLLDEYVTRPYDRILFPSLVSLDTPAAAAAEGKPADDIAGEFSRAGQETGAAESSPRHR